MAKVVWKSIYSQYDNNRLFDLSSCDIGQNLLLPNIKLREKLHDLGIDLDTFDLRDGNEKLVVLNDLSNELYKCCNFIDKVKYFLKKRYKRDALKYAKKKGIKSILIISEPYIISPLSYDKKYHSSFDAIYTWADTLVDNVKYFKYCIPQSVPKENYFIPFDKKKMLVLMASNKSSSFKGEYYSKRKEFIDFANDKGVEFDLYGGGWGPCGYPFYRGLSDNKLETLSQYKYCICYENFGEPGYITEKIFDCFFSNCVPVYLGASNVTDYIPKNCFIDRRDFNSNEELYEYLKSLSQTKHEEFLSNIKAYLQSDAFISKFSDETYSSFFANVIEKEVKDE